MKLYATVTSERNSRPAKKGGDEMLRIQITHKNEHIATIEVNDVAQSKPQLIIHKWAEFGTTITRP